MLLAISQDNEILEVIEFDSDNLKLRDREGNEGYYNTFKYGLAKIHEVSIIKITTNPIELPKLTVELDLDIYDEFYIDNDTMNDIIEKKCGKCCIYRDNYNEWKIFKLI